MILFISFNMVVNVLNKSIIVWLFFLFLFLSSASKASNALPDIGIDDASDQKLALDSGTHDQLRQTGLACQVLLHPVAGVEAFVPDIGGNRRDQDDGDRSERKRPHLRSFLRTGSDYGLACRI